VQLRFVTFPSRDELSDALTARLPPDAYFEDVHGSAAYKRQVTRYLSEQIREELA
jgi:hypothetical protein